MTEIKTIGLGEALQNNDSSEGAIHVLLPNQEIKLINAIVHASKEDDYSTAFINLEDSSGKIRTMNSSAISIVSKIEKMIANGLGKTIHVRVRVEKVPNVIHPEKDDYWTLTEL
jgi:uncharacterized protein (DUF736 family)